MSENGTGQDFIVSELLSELKAGNERKDKQIRSLHHALVATILAALIAILVAVGAFLWYLNQYDFTSTQSIEQSAEGVYALIDSEGNTIAWDISPEELNNILEVITSGEGTVD